MLSDNGYCTRENLTTPGPDRLIATGKSHDLHAAAAEHPAQGAPPEDIDPIAAMQHRLRTPQGIATYAQRSHIAETPFGHAKTTSASDGSPAVAWPEHAANGPSTPPSTTSARSSTTSPEHRCPPNHSRQHQRTPRQINDNLFRDSPLSVG